MIFNDFIILNNTICYIQFYIFSLTLSLNFSIYFYFFQLSPIERYALKFVENTGSSWAAIQLKAVEIEMEQQKRDWEERRLAQQKQDELKKLKTKEEENELLTYSREDALNKVNINTNKNIILSKYKSEKPNHLLRSSKRGKNSIRNGTIIRNNNGILKRNEKSVNNEKRPSSKNIDVSFKRTTRNSSRKNIDDNDGKFNAKLLFATRRALSLKRESSCSPKTKNVRTASETTQSTSPSQHTSVHDTSDSECSLDVMIDSNDINDSDSNSAHNSNHESSFDSSSQEEDTIKNDDITIADETTVEKNPQAFKEFNCGMEHTSSPRTRSRGHLKIDLWSLDESPILTSKRQRTSFSIKRESPQKEKQLKDEYGVKECKVAMVDIQKPKKSCSIKLRAQKQFRPVNTNNQILGVWVQKKSESLQKHKPISSNMDNEDIAPKTRTRKNASSINNTL